jgi:hypothetical protein
VDKTPKKSKAQVWYFFIFGRPLALSLHLTPYIVMRKSLHVMMLCSAMIVAAPCARAQFDIESFRKSNRHWSLGLVAGFARPPEVITPYIENQLYADGSVYRLTHHIEAGRHSHFNYGQQFPVNRWLHAKWMITAGYYQLGYRLDAVFERPADAPLPNYEPPAEFSSLQLRPVFSLGLLPGLVSYLPLGSRFWWMNGAMFGPVVQAGDFLNSIVQVYDYEPSSVHFRWHAMLETGIECQPFKKQDNMKLFSSFQWLHLGRGNPSGYWHSFTHFGQLQIGLRVKG